MGNKLTIAKLFSSLSTKKKLEKRKLRKAFKSLTDEQKTIACRPVLEPEFRETCKKSEEEQMKRADTSSVSTTEIKLTEPEEEDTERLKVRKKERNHSL